MNAVNVTTASASKATKAAGKPGKKERTRKKLIESALLMLAERDVGDLTLYGLAEAADMSNGTVHNYFGSREDVMDAVAVELASRFSAEIEMLNQSATSAAQRVATGIQLYMLRAEAEPAWARALLRVVSFHQGLNSAFISFIRSDLRMGIEAGEFKIDDEGVAIDMIVSTGIAGIRAVVEGRAKADYRIKMATLVLRGLGSSEAKIKKALSLDVAGLQRSKTMIN